MTLTDELLRDEIGSGLKPAQIARKYSISRQAVSARVKRMQLSTTGLAVVAPDESRDFVNRQLDAMEELTRSFGHVKLLSEACDRWLRDAKDPERYDIGPRGEEVMVTYWELSDGSDSSDGSDDGPQIVKAKASLQELIARVEKHGLCTVRSETKIADPRHLILSTAQEIRQTVQLGVQLAQMLADARAMESFRAALLAEIAKVDPEIAKAVAEAVRRFLILRAAADGPDPVSAA